MNQNSPFTLAACAEMIYLDLPLVERVNKINERGLEVELWDWTKPEKDLEALAETGATFGSMTGYISGNLTDQDEIVAFLDSAKKSIEAAKVIGCKRLNFHGTGLGPTGLPVKPVEHVTGAMWAQAALTIEKLARIGEDAGVVFTLENLNLPVDHPGTPFGLAADTLALVSSVDSPHLRMNLDLYHAQIGEGNLIELCRRALPWIGEIQVADVPGRCEPGTGEINYAGVARALAAMGYRGVVGLEAFARGEGIEGSGRALDAFRTAFTP